MAVDWPSALPQAPASFNEQPASNIVRTEPDSGPTKTRRRFTKAKTSATMSFLLTIDQYLLLKAFYKDDLKDGTVPMRFLHPWLQTVLDMMVLDPPQAGDDGNIGVRVSMKVEWF